MKNENYAHPKFTELNIVFLLEKYPIFAKNTPKFEPHFGAFFHLEKQCLVPVSRGLDEW